MPTVTTNGVETYYERQGDGPPLVFLHQAGGNHQLWKRQVEALSDAYDVIAYDIRGHGKTGGSQFQRYTIDLFADDLHALVEALELESPRICGLSLGGMTALTYATRYSADLSALAVAGTVTPDPQSLGERAVFDVITPAQVWGIRLVGYERIQKPLKWISERIGDTDIDEVEAEAEQLVDEDAEIDGEEYQKIMRAANDYTHSPVRLENISVPTLVMYGEDEPFVEDHASIYRQRVSNVRVRAIPDAGHNSNIENPERFTRILREFLDDA